MTGNGALRRVHGQVVLASDEASPESAAVDVTMHMAGVCGTDLDIIRGARTDVASVLGHEGVGVVGRVADSTTGWSVGDRVVFMPVSPKDQDRVLGHSYDGVWRQRVAVSEEQLTHGLLHRIPPTLEDELACLVEPLACAMYGFELLRRWSSCQRVSVIGGGAMGMMGAVLAQTELGAEVCVVDPDPRVQRRVSEFGMRCSCAGFRPDAVVVCTPRKALENALNQVLDCAAPQAAVDLMTGADGPLTHPELLHVLDAPAIRRGNACGSVGCGSLIGLRSGSSLTFTGHRGASIEHFSAAVRALTASPRTWGRLIGPVLGYRDSTLSEEMASRVAGRPRSSGKLLISFRNN